MGLKEALRLKFFDSKELDVRATKTPKGDTPYLQLVQQNLYPIREPEAPGGQGASGSAPIVSPAVQAQAMVTADDAGGRIAGSSMTKGSGSKIIIEDEGVHLSVGDSETHASGEKGDNDRNEDEDVGGDGEDEGEQPRIALKRKRAAPTKTDPKAKQPKRTKADFKTITLDDDDQVTEFSTAGGVLANLDAHLHEGRTPRDHPLQTPVSPLSFGKGVLRLLRTCARPTPRKLCFLLRVSLLRELHLMCLGQALRRLMVGTVLLRLGDFEGADAAHALEKYVPEWSLVNKDRIVDAVSAKMSLFHLGTPAEHSYYRKMNGPELGNTLMLNQAQSNSLVVETYKRWVESESLCHKLKREVAHLKGEGDVRSKTKQELVSLRSQVDRLKGQVSEAKEVTKSSQASAAAAHEARDKALQDLETSKSKLADLEKKLSGAEMKHAAELKEMQTSHDQLLADYHRLVDGTFTTFSSSPLFLYIIVIDPLEHRLFAAKDEIERSRDREIESHKTTIDEARGMLIRCERDMIEAYAQLSELKLTKHWFLTEGVAWVVKLVHQSPELERVVADLVNSVNAVGANEGIKQGFKAAQDLVGSAEEVPGYDAGAQSALDAAVKAFDELNISVLDKVADLIDEPLPVIQQRSKLPIVGDDDNIVQV
ncbi:hypothetical protein HanIR_Chr13g0636131 [Helianthus annuus]|nr:hypothetical protein HanIR_Chr13g0636131 [Helianthus annuus]